MTRYEVAGHPVFLDLQDDDVEVFWTAARAYTDSYRGTRDVRAGATREGLGAVLPQLLDRVGAQLLERSRAGA